MSTTTGERWVYTRTYWYEGDVSDFAPRIEVRQRQPARALIRVVQRVVTDGRRYRIDHADGSPSRLFDGTTTLLFSYFRSDQFYRPGPVVPIRLPLRPDRSYLDVVRPHPLPDGTEGLPALSVCRVERDGRMLIEEVRPRSPDRPDEAGYRNLFDPDTGRLVWRSYGTDERPCGEWWSAVTVVPDLDEAVFGWAGPSRELPAGLAGWSA